jgi:uncharacterized protein (TIRG00374 family)
VALAAIVWVGVSLALAVVTFWMQATHVGGLQSFDLPLLAPAIGFAVTSFALRILRWHFFLGATGAHPSILTSARTQFVGFSLTMTPGKVGEAYKCYLIERRTGVPTARTVPIVVVEKLMDAIAFSGLALLAAAVAPQLAGSVGTAARTLLVAGTVCVALAFFLHRARPDDVASLLLRFIGKAHIGQRVASLAALALAGSAEVLKPSVLTRGALLSVGARTCDGLALAWVVWALGIDLPAVVALFAFNSAGALGGLSMLPGGIGVVEASISVLLGTFGAAPAAALAGALAARLLTFWIWVAVGLALLVRSGVQSND